MTIAHYGITIVQIALYVESDHDKLCREATLRKKFSLRVLFQTCAKADSSLFALLYHTCAGNVALQIPHYILMCHSMQFVAVSMQAWLACRISLYARCIHSAQRKFTDAIPLVSGYRLGECKAVWPAVNVRHNTRPHCTPVNSDRTTRSTHTHTLTHTHARTRTRTRTHAHTHTHTQQYSLHVHDASCTWCVCACMYHRQNQSTPVLFYHNYRVI